MYMYFMVLHTVCHAILVLHVLMPVLYFSPVAQAGKDASYFSVIVVGVAITGTLLVYDYTTYIQWSHESSDTVSFCQPTLSTLGQVSFGDKLRMIVKCIYGTCSQDLCPLC